MALILMLILQVKLQVLKGNNFKKNNSKINNGALHHLSLAAGTQRWIYDH